MADFGAWLESDECMSQDAEYRADEVDLYRRYLERGGDASHMRALCPQTRVVGVGLTDSLRNLEPASETELFVLHELYHAFQQDLEEEGQRRTAGEPRTALLGGWSKVALTISLGCCYSMVIKKRGKNLFTNKPVKLSVKIKA